MSNYTKATNFATKDTLPTGNSGKIVKGTEIDDELNAIASAISSKADTASPTFTGTPAAPTATTGSNTTQIATTAFVQTALSAAFTTGMIMLWSGSSASIPSGWLLCDGSNSTPDLRNKFVVGAGSTYSVGATGGSADAVVVSHTHTATSVVTDPGHNHQYIRDKDAGSISSHQYSDSNAGYLNTSTSTTGITVATTNASTGVSGTNANLPPYYALCYIMKS
jgi:hypothetical protein